MRWASFSLLATDGIGTRRLRRRWHKGAGSGQGRHAGRRCLRGGRLVYRTWRAGRTSVHSATRRSPPNFKQKGDWCKEHNRPESQCFLCNPKLEAKFAAEYEAKYGKKPPKPEGKKS